MIFTLLNLSVFIAAVIAAVDTARHIDASISEWCLAISSGAVIGGLFAFVLWRAAEFADIRFSRITSVLMRNLCVSGLYLSAIFWAVVSMEVSGLITSRLLRHLSNT